MQKHDHHKLSKETGHPLLSLKGHWKLEKQSDQIPDRGKAIAEQY